MRFTKLVTILSLGAAVILSGCSDPGDESRLADVQSNQGVLTIQYDGRPLDCITWRGSHEERGMTCDFVKYHFGEGGDLESLTRNRAE